MSLSSPRSSFSFPELQLFSRSNVLPAMHSKTASAAAASGESVPFRKFIIAPAPAKSSTHGRSVPSGQRSPAGIRAMLRPVLKADSAAARQFRRHPMIVRVEPVDRLRVEPFGDGKTRRAPLGRFKREAGESEKPFTFFLSATSALTDPAKL